MNEMKVSPEYGVIGPSPNMLFVAFPAHMGIEVVIKVAITQAEL